MVGHSYIISSLEKQFEVSLGYSISEQDKPWATKPDGGGGWNGIIFHWTTLPVVLVVVWVVVHNILQEAFHQTVIGSRPTPALSGQASVLGTKQVLKRNNGYSKWVTANPGNTKRAHVCIAEIWVDILSM